MVIDHLHGRHEMPENIGPVRRLWVMTLLGEPPAASTTSTYVCSAAANFWSTRRAAATTSPRRRLSPTTVATHAFALASFAWGTRQSTT